MKPDLNPSGSFGLPTNRRNIYRPVLAQGALDSFFHVNHVDDNRDDAPQISILLPDKGRVPRISGVPTSLSRMAGTLISILCQRFTVSIR